MDRGHLESDHGLRPDSPGCDNCYALSLAERLKAMGQAKYQRDGKPLSSGPGFGLTLHADPRRAPDLATTAAGLRRLDGSDLFHEAVPDDFIREVFAVIAKTPRHTYQVLTKRTKRMLQLAPLVAWPENLWMGVSVESNKYAFRAETLRRVPAAVRFVSVEPFIGPVPGVRLEAIDWVVAGGESGPHARPLDEAWVVHLRDRCSAAGVPFFFKQWGGRTPKAGGRLLDGRTWDEMPPVRRNVA